MARRCCVTPRGAVTLESSTMSDIRMLVWVAMLWAGATGLHAQATSQETTTTVRGRVEVIGAEGDVPGLPASSPANPRLVQRNKSFDPHILVVPVGSMVEFPNRDPFFHNVFSLFEGKRFDLGLYEAGTSRMVRFDRLGISYIFCNFHPQLNSLVITIPPPPYA